MKLSEALTKVRKQGGTGGGALFRAALCCGFTPLHLSTFFQAHLRDRLPRHYVTVSHGLYGDLVGNLSREAEAAEATAVVIEWPDLDPRLGYRGLGGWLPSLMTSILETVESRLEQLAEGIVARRTQMPVAVALPTLEPAPVFSTARAFWPTAGVRLDLALARFAIKVAEHKVAIVNAHTLAQISPANARHDVKAELGAGFPYTLTHGDALGEMLAELLARPGVLKKGLISDLDDTVWRGIVGEIGPAEVRWDLDGRAQIHGLYQQCVAALAEQGTLVAVASKNDPSVFQQVSEDRPDLIFPRSAYPVETHWGPKSESVGRILRTWNIGADSVVFVDDSPLELAEVKAAYPEIECLLFPKNDPSAAVALLRQLRDWFGKESINDDDRIRLDSIRLAGQFDEGISSGDRQEEFLASLQAKVTIRFHADGGEPRVLELVNKTNQFNLNGVRHSEADWLALQASPGGTIVSVAYEDRFGPLGTIAVMAGQVRGEEFDVKAWVMSCRAFSRRIEYQTLRQIFAVCGVNRVLFDYQPTAKNGPLTECLKALCGEPGAILEAGQFQKSVPALAHKVEVHEFTVKA